MSDCMSCQHPDVARSAATRSLPISDWMSRPKPSSWDFSASFPPKVARNHPTSKTPNCQDIWSDPHYKARFPASMIEVPGGNITSISFVDNVDLHVKTWSEIGKAKSGKIGKVKSWSAWWICPNVLSLEMFHGLDGQDMGLWKVQIVFEKKTARPKYNKHHDKKDSSTAECIAFAMCKYTGNHEMIWNGEIMSRFKGLTNLHCIQFPQLPYRPSPKTLPMPKLGAIFFSVVQARLTVSDSAGI